MSTKNNALVAAAATALGMVVLAGASPVCENLLNDLQINGFGAAEIDAKGRTLVLVSVKGVGVNPDVVRPVADSLGNERLFADGNAAVSLAKRTALAVGTSVKFVQFVSVVTVGDPLVALKSAYKRFKAEAATGLKQANVMIGKKTAAIALGWDLATGTPENTEYLDIVARDTSVTEWKAYCDAKVTSLAASLTASGVDPLTVI